MSRAAPVPNVSTCRSPSWGAWIEMASANFAVKYTTVAPPRGERGLKCAARSLMSTGGAVAPPRGERGLKSMSRHRPAYPLPRRSPSWGAWIEINSAVRIIAAALCRSPSWGAWIEISARWIVKEAQESRSPSWGAWIEIMLHAVSW